MEPKASATTRASSIGCIAHLGIVGFRLGFAPAQRVDLVRGEGELERLPHVYKRLDQRGDMRFILAGRRRDTKTLVPIALSLFEALRWRIAAPAPAVTMGGKCGGENESRRIAAHCVHY